MFAVRARYSRYTTMLCARTQLGIWGAARENLHRKRERVIFQVQYFLLIRVRGRTGRQTVYII